ncbi:MAG: lysophospholipid acyltransferase family protein [Eubacteriales bacterium]|jgi:1-acyl-sn-glycerol-3-phosphate acyltransferase
MLYKFCRFFVKIFMFTIFRIRVVGKEKMVRSGGVILCANHTSNWDPLLLIVNYPYPVHYMAKAELFEKAFPRWFFSHVYVFPVHREGNDLHAIKTAMGILKKGMALGMFPEGTRVKDGKEMDAKAGVTMLAIKSGAVIQPVAICGPVKPFHRVELRIGDPIYYDKKALGKLENEDYKRLAQDVMHKIKELQHEKL